MAKEGIKLPELAPADEEAAAWGRVFKMGSLGIKESSGLPLILRSTHLLPPLQSLAGNSVNARMADCLNCKYIPQTLISD